ncbi:hypothetical protein GCM10023322_61840 [Rugosimonospora acidiphila]|uniref:Protein-glutamine gamma-glutamyltransferase-like C-terminal domain-containing protein n=1 Tax=Rugosimonospora acidiphila TaxID=556531 RepID=A0ABP9SGK2_9ACTN
MTRLRRFVPLLAVAALLAAAAIAASLATPQITSVPVPHGADSPQPLPSDGALPTGNAAPTAGAVAQHTMQVPGWVTTLVSALCACLVAGVVALIIWMMVRDSIATRRGRLPVEREPANPAASRDTVLAAVDAGLSDLDDTDGDPRRAVIACWVRLEQAAASAGTPRQAGDSPTDLVLRLLAAHQVSATVLYPLAETYRIARYATQPVDTGMRDRARSALRQLRTELANEPVIGSSK